MALRGKAAHVLGVERAPGREALSPAVLDQRGEVPLVGARGVRGELPFVAQAVQEAGHAVGERLAHAPRAVSASVTSSPIRTRKSVLMVGR